MQAYDDDMTGGVEAAPEKPRGNTLAVLGRLMELPNIAPYLKEAKLAELASKAIAEYEIDVESRKEWKGRLDAALELAMLVANEKTYPFERAANIKYPLLTTAALQFNARAYPAIVQAGRVARCMTWGDDPQGHKAARADRVSEHLSYQLLVEQPEWEEDTDRLLMMLPIVGSVFRKVYHDPSIGRNCTRLVTADRFVVNYRARSINDAPRLTEQLYLYPYEIDERIRDGRFAEFDYGKAVGEEDDDDAPHCFLEQHRLIDLDEDGYPEPYIVTIHEETETVCRIVANFAPDTVRVSGDRVASIRRVQYYTKYQFLPSPDGGFYGWGFGWLLKDIGEAVNSTLNQMMDAGHLATVQGGLVSASMGIKDASIRLKPGEWRVVNTNGPIAQSIMPINYPGPSPVHFSLLDLLLSAGRDVAAIKDVLSGDVKTNMQPTTVMALIEQGLQVFTAIYKRVHRALKAELGMLARLNRENLDPQQYAAFFDGQQAYDPKADYAERDMDVVPISDPNQVSRMQQLAKAQFLMEWARENPIANQAAVNRRVLEAAQIDDVEELIQPPDEEQAFVMKLMMMLELKDKELSQIKTMSEALKNIAQAEGAEAGDQMQRYKLIFDVLKAEASEETARASAGNDGQGRIPGMEGQPGNATGIPGAFPDSGSGGIGPEGSAGQFDAAAGIGMGGMPVAGGA